MPLKYDKDAKAILERDAARGVFLMVIREDGGLSTSMAFSESDLRPMLEIPQHLRHMADEMQKNHGIRVSQH